MSDHHEQSDCDREMRSSFEEGGSSSAAAAAAGAQQQPAKRKKRELTAEERAKNNARHRRDRAKNKDELARLRKIELEYNKLQLNAKGTKAETGEQSAVIDVMLNRSDDYLKQLKVTKEMAEKGSRVVEDCWNNVANSGPGKEIIQQAMSEDCQITSGTTTNRIGNKELQDEIQKVVSEEDVLVLHDCYDENLEGFAANMMQTPPPQSLEDVMNNQGGNEVITAADFGYGDLRGVKMTDFEGYSIPEKLHPTATSLLRGIPTILPTTSKSIRIYNLRTDIVICLCAAVLEIENTPYAKMGYDEIRRWHGAIREAKDADFKVGLIESGLDHIVKRLDTTTTPGPFMNWNAI